MFTTKKFSLLDEEYDDIKKWAETHECNLRTEGRPSKSCCGGEISVIFTPTSIGTSIKARWLCGAELDLDVAF